jgi:tRNA nucleotidyltransferase (CCA-adding enzyme)
MSDVATMPFVRALLERGARVYMVGGTIRDTLLGLARKDLDLLVTGMSQELLIRLLRRYGRVQLIGRAFGVIKFRPRHWDDPPIDIALPRTEVSTGVGHRDFEVAFDHTLPVETDLGRRDFTINAMARDLADGHLVDPFNGYQDLQQRLLRQVSPAAFPEDPLRMLRGVQLATRFDLQVAPHTYEAMRTHAATITTVAAERIAEELRKLFQARAPSRGFILMRDVGLLRHIMPEIARLVGVSYATVAPQSPAALFDAFTCTMRRLDALRQHGTIQHGDRIDVVLAALWLQSGLPDVLQTSETCTPRHVAEHSAPLARRRLEALRITTIGAHLDTIEKLIVHSVFDPDEVATPAGLRHFVHRVGVDRAFMLLDLHLAERIGNQPAQPLDDLLDLRLRLRTELDRRVPLALNDLAVDGNDLRQLGIPPDRRMGECLRLLLSHVLDDPRQNTRDHLLTLAQQMVASGIEPPGEA